MNEEAAGAEMACYMKQGSFVCELRQRPARQRSDAGGASKPAKPPPKPDAAGEAAMAAARLERRMDAEIAPALGFPEPPRPGFLVQGLNRPSPERGRRVPSENFNQLLAARNLGAMPAERRAARLDERRLEAAAGAFVAPRVLPPVPTVAALMYDN